MTFNLPTNDFRMYINGELKEGEGKTSVICCPGNEEKVAEVKLASKAQVEAALEAARDAFPVWSSMPLEKREAWIIKLRDEIAKEADKLIDLLIYETGKIRAHAAFEPGSLTSYLTYFLEQAKCNHTEGIRDTSGGKNMFLAVREPVGVVVASLAWNFPMHNLATKIGPILASGCTAVIKPATKTPLSTMYFGEILERIGFPKGVLNIIVGDAKEIGEVLNGSDIPAMLTMIGSTSGGLKMIKDSTTSVKRFSMELGGNAPAIVTSSANMAAAVSHIIGNKMRCAGQTCVSPQRAIVERSIYEEFVAACKEEAEKAVCGTLDEDANTGALIDKKAVERMEALVKDATLHGAVVVAGGKKPDNKEKGYYFLPTVLTEVTREMRVWKEEVFGPILSIIPYDTLEEAVKLANDTEYGLSSYIWAKDLHEIAVLSKGIKYGIVNVNGPGTGASVPHGGIKNSGIGKDGSRYSLEEYTYIKGMRIAL